MTRGLGVGKETTYGQDVALSEYTSIIDENIALDNGVEGDFEVGYIAKPKPKPGNFDCKGGFKFYAEPENMGLILLGLCGAASDTATIPEAGAYKHSFAPMAAPQYLTLGIVGDVTASQRTYPGWCVGSLKGSFSPGKKLLIESSGFGKTVNIDALASPTFSTKEGFAAHESTCKIATVQNGDIQAATWEISRAYGEKDYVHGSRIRKYAKAMGFEAKGTMDILFETKTELEMFLEKAAAAAPGATLPKQRLDFKFDNDIVIGATATNHQLNFAFPDVIYQTEKANINKQERIVQNITWEAFQPASGNLFGIELFNAVASY